MENEIIDSSEKPEQAAASWIKSHPEILEKWLQGVTTYSGESALPAVKKQLNIL